MVHSDFIAKCLFVMTMRIVSPNIHNEQSCCERLALLDVYYSWQSCEHVNKVVCVEF